MRSRTERRHMSTPPPPNTEQFAYWNEAMGPHWVALQERLDVTFAPLTAALMAFADPQPGESALDVGCGCGVTSLAISQRVGSQGHVLGVDLSRPMLAVAERRARASELSNLSFIQADAMIHTFEPQCFDLVASQLGVMFFDDPVRAFANVHRTVRPGGRLGFICFRALRENEWFSVPLDAATPLLPPMPPQDPLAPGPLSFADPERVRRILTTAGFVDVELQPFDTKLPLGMRGDALELVLQIGSLPRVLAGRSDDERSAVRAAVDVALQPHEASGQVSLGVGMWLVGARV